MNVLILCTAVAALRLISSLRYLISTAIGISGRRKALQKRVVVIGSGIAGLIAALRISRKFQVELVTKSALVESSTRWAQGGIAAAMFEDDSAADHIADTMRAGAGLCDPEMVRLLCTLGPDRIRDLMALGVQFDAKDGVLERGLEAAHSRPRVLHAGGDATGLSIELALVRAVQDAPNIQIVENAFASDIVLRNGTVEGVVLHRPGRPVQVRSASAVVLASGGAGHLYRHTTNPLVATGDGVAMALRAGAEAANLEFYQFHPTALAVPGAFLISEAVRGEGAVLRNAEGGRFMLGLHPEAELAPRDIVARSIARQMARQQGAPVYLDATALGEHFLKLRFPRIDSVCRQHGFDWARAPIPVRPAAHYWMGGIRTDRVGRTSLPGLYAVGEVASTGVHGANRLASNSLLESLVFAWECAEHVLREGLPVDSWRDLPEVSGMRSTLASEVGRHTLPVEREALQALMWQAAGIDRNGEELALAAAALQGWHGEDQTVGQMEIANLLLLAQCIVQCALSRQESRGAHFRSDFPDADPEDARPSLLSLDDADTAATRSLREHIGAS